MANLRSIPSIPYIPMSLPENLINKRTGVESVLPKEKDYIRNHIRKQNKEHILLSGEMTQEQQKTLLHHFLAFWQRSSATKGITDDFPL